MSDETLITLWLLWRDFYYWTMLALLAVGFIYVAMCLTKIKVSRSKKFERAWLSAAALVPVFGGGINWGLGKWIGLIVFGAD